MPVSPVDNRPMTWLALARTRDQLEDWKRRYQIHSRSIRFVETMQDVRGIANFSLIVFSGWMDGVKDEKLILGDYLLRKAGDVYFTDTHVPQVNGQGIIVYWERRKDVERREIRR